MTVVSNQRAILLTMAVFFLQPLSMGAWFALIPQVKAALGLSKAELAFALLGSPIAILLSLQVAGKIVNRVGPRRLMIQALPLQCLLSVLLLLAPNGMMLFFVLLLFGAAVGFMEVAINVYCGRLEKTASVLIMNRCHGFWSLGLMAGAGLVTLSSISTAVTTRTVIAVISVVFGSWVTYQLPRLGESKLTEKQHCADIYGSFGKLFISAAEL